MRAPPTPRPPIAATKALVGVMVAAFLVSVVIGGGMEGSEDPRVLYRLGAQDAAAIWRGEWWRLVTSIFLHAGPLHLLVNVFSLYNLGLVLEPTLGPRRFLALFFVSGLVSSLATLAFVQDTLSVGASGAVFGLAGLLLADELTRRRMYRRIAVDGGPRWRPRVSIIPILLVNLGLGLAIPVINNYAHVGGLAGGFLLGSAWIESNLRQRARARLAYVGLGVLIGALGTAGFAPVLTGEAAERVARAASIAVREGRLDDALEYANDALALAPGDPRYHLLRGGILYLQGQPAAAAEDMRAACAGGLAQACGRSPD